MNRKFGDRFSLQSVDVPLPSWPRLLKDTITAVCALNPSVDKLIGIDLVPTSQTFVLSVFHQFFERILSFKVLFANPENYFLTRSMLSRLNPRPSKSSKILNSWLPCNSIVSPLTVPPHASLDFSLIAMSFNLNSFGSSPWMIV